MENVRLTDLINVYETDVTLGSGLKLSAKPFTTGQLKSLLVYENETNPVVIEDALDNIITSSITTPNFSIDDLTLNDRMDLMLELRNITKGPFYNFTYKCDKCGQESIINKDLRELPKSEVKETETVITVNDKLSFSIGFPTRGDQKKAYDYQGAFDSRCEMDSLKMADIATTTMAFAIRDVFINGNVAEGYKDDDKIGEKIAMLETIPRPIFDSITQFFKDNRYGTEFEFEFNCIHCFKKFSMVVPINDFFV